MASLLSLLVVVLSCSLALGDIAPENRGSDFFVAFAFNLGTPSLVLYISSDVANTVMVSSKTGVVQTVNVAAKGTVQVTISNQYLIPNLNTVGNYGVRVNSTTSTIFTLAGLNTVPYTTDGFLAYPVNVIGTSYIAASYTGLSGGAVPSYVYVVAPQDGTVVTFSGAGISTVSYTLSAYQTVAVGGLDITGCSVTSTKPISVFGGNQCTDVTLHDGACNLLVEQLPPTNTWDKDFITVPLATRTAGDVFRVVSGTAGTVVTVNGAVVSTLASGAFYEFISTVTNIIHTSNPAMILQYSRGSSADGASADPFMMYIPPINQFSANYYFTALALSGWTNYVNVVVQSGQQSGLSLDGNAITATWKPVTGSSNPAYVYAQVQVSGNSHHITHSSPIQPFQIIVYGFGSYDGYGYVGGSRFAPLAAPCTKTTTVAGDGIDNDCDGKVDEELLNGIDDDLDGLIDEDLAFVPQVCGNGIIEGTEQCDSSACCSATCTFSASSVVCRNSNGPCDVAETCTGSSDSCPADSFQSSSTTCRASNGPCDVAETCTGSTASCPADSFQSSSVTCRSSNGDCDVAETCTGSDASCPADSFQSSSVTCRSSNGDCDVAETCTGSDASCPADSFQSSSVTCRASNGDCDVAETCTGSSASCPADSFQSSSVTCRGSNGVCDVAETCTGSSASCPADSFQSSSVTCRSINGPCDVAETCTGSSAACPADSFASSSTVCRPSTDASCDPAEKCTGSSGACPADVLSQTAVCFCKRHGQTPKPYPDYFCTNSTNFYQCVYGVYAPQSALMRCAAGTACGCPDGTECGCNGYRSPCTWPYAVPYADCAH